MLLHYLKPLVQLAYHIRITVSVPCKYDGSGFPALKLTM